MININDYSNLKFIFLLLAVLILLLIARNFLIRRIYKQELEIANEIFIGNEEIQEDYLEVVNKSNGTMAVLADALGKNEAGRTRKR